MNYLLIAFLLNLSATAATRPSTAIYSGDVAQDKYNEAIEAEQSGKINRALELYTAAISLDPEFEYAYVNRGSIYSSLGKNKEAMADLDKAIKLDPKDAMAYNNRSNLLNHLGRWKEAIQGYEKAVALNPKILPAYMGAGRSNEMLKNFPEAISWLSRLLKLNPKCFECLRIRALLYAKNLQPKQALEDIKAAKKLKLNLEQLATIKELEESFVSLQEQLSDPHISAEQREQIRRELQGAEG